MITINDTRSHPVCHDASLSPEVLAERLCPPPVCVCVCVCVWKQLPSNQSFDKQISSHQKGGGVSRWGEWIRKATAYKWGPLDHASRGCN